MTCSFEIKIYGQKTLFHRTGEQFLIRSTYLYLTQVQQKSLEAYFHLWMSMKLMILISEAEQVSHQAKMGALQGLLNSIAMDLHYHNLAKWCIGLHKFQHLNLAFMARAATSDTSQSG